MKIFEFNSVEESYPILLKALLTEGEKVSPRGQLTKEISPACITIKDPTKRVISSKIRKLNYGFMCAEAIWILEGSNDVNFIGHYNSVWKKFSDDNKILNGAYGNRIFKWDAGYRQYYNDDKNFEYKKVFINQFNEAYNQLKKDPDTRQASIIMFDPYRDYTNTKDKPCTNLLRFMIRNNKLNMTVFMRSNDIWLGYPYDVFNFTLLQEIMASNLGIKVGTYTHIADSFHIYENNFEKAEQIVNEMDTRNIYNKEYIKLSDENMNTSDLCGVFNIEYKTRTITDISVDNVKNDLDIIKNKYLQSMAAVLALYNFRKYFRSQVDMNELKIYITNEFNPLTENWKEKTK